MIEIVGEFDKGWFGDDGPGRRTNSRLFDQTTRAYGVDFHLAEDLELFVPTKPLVVFDEHGSVDLEDFEHPNEAHYIFGRSGRDLRLLYPDETLIRVPTPNHIPMFGHVVVGIVLEDRRRKWQSQ